MPKKVLHIFGVMDRGGAELRTLSTMNEMQKNDIDYEFCVLSGKIGSLDKQIVQSGSKVHYCKLGITFPFRFMQLLRREQFDAVHSHVALVSGFILILAQIVGVKQRIAHFRSTQEKAERSTTRKIRNKILRSFINFSATNIIGVSKGSLAAFWGEKWLQEPRCTTIYNGVLPPENTYKDQQLWSNHNVKNNASIILHVGRMTEAKNHLALVDIFAHYLTLDNQAQLVLIGKEHPKIKQEILKKADALNCREQLHILGEFSEVLSFMINADALLLPSLWEGLPGVVIEAASVGLPVVASDLSGVKEIAEQIPSISSIPLTANKDTWNEAISDAINTSSEERKELAQYFPKTDFNLAMNIEKLHALYR